MIKGKCNLYVVFLLSVILLYYIWTALPGSYSYSPKVVAGNYYNLLANAFLNGQLHLDIKPKKELLALPDPYDPSQNCLYSLLDATLYNGKYYLYFGPTPVIIFYLPYKILTGANLSNYWTVLALMFGSLIWAALLLKHLHKEYFGEAPLWMLFLAIGVLGFANIAPYMLRLTAHYQVAASCAQFFLMGGIYFLCRAVDGSKSNLIFLIFGSLFLGLSVGSRLNFAFGCIAILLMIIWLNRKKQFFGKKFLIGLLLPFSFCLFLLATYNYLRFGNPFEFGTTYQLCAINFRKIPLFNIKNIILNLYIYLFHSPIISIYFPFIHLNEDLPKFLPRPECYLHERITGIFPGVPYVLLGLLAPFVWLLSLYSTLRKMPKLNGFPSYEFSIIFSPAILILGSLLLLPFISIRYIADFITLLILASSIVWFYFDLKLIIRPYSRLFLRTVAAVCALVSIVNGAAFGIAGSEYGPGLRGQRPEEFRKLESFFKPVSKVLAHFKKENGLSRPIEKQWICR